MVHLCEAKVSTEIKILNIRKIFKIILLLSSHIFKVFYLKIKVLILKDVGIFLSLGV